MASSNRNINIHWYNEPHRSSEQNRVRRVGATRAEENLNTMGKACKDLAHGLPRLRENEPYMDRRRQCRVKRQKDDKNATTSGRPPCG